MQNHNAHTAVCFDDYLKEPGPRGLIVYTPAHRLGNDRSRSSLVSKNRRPVRWWFKLGSVCATRTTTPSGANNCMSDISRPHARDRGATSFTKPTPITPSPNCRYAKTHVTGGKIPHLRKSSGHSSDKIGPTMVTSCCHHRQSSNVRRALPQPTPETKQHRRRHTYPNFGYHI